MFCKPIPFSAALAALSLLVGAAPVAAEGQKEAWQRDCDQSRCSLIRPLVEQGTGRKVATFIALVSKEQETPLIGVAIPLGVALEPGVRLVAGESIMDVPFQVCFPDGCRALRPASQQEFGTLGEAETLEIRFFPYGAEKPVSVSMPFADFREAVRAARAELSAP